jgi:hypothetical protein
VAGPFTIQRFPKGLLDFLGMKGSGRTPSELEAELRSVIDSTPLYLSDRAAGIVSNTGNMAADGVQAFASAVATVPAGEIWIPLNCSLQRDTAGLTAGNSFEFYITLFQAQFGRVILPGLGTVVAAPASGGGATGFVWHDRCCLLPGDGFGAYTAKGTYAGTNALVFNLHIYRLFI